MKSEFEFIQNIKKRFSLDRVGDDCAILPKDANADMVITADMLVEDVDFRLEWTKPEFLGHKALAVSLSDIAAMGAHPIWAMLSIAVPGKLWKGDFVDRFYEGWHQLASEFKVELIGGDISRSPDKFVLDSTVGGEVPRGQAVRRSGAKVGDAIFVSGSLGGAAGALNILERECVAQPNELILKQLTPYPRLALAESLRAHSIPSSMIDISDGLSSDLMHVCQASRVGAKIDTIPVDKNLYQCFGSEESMQFALHGGEDFELLFTVPQEKLFDLKDLRVTRIGEITCQAGKIELITDGKAKILEPRGYSHF